MRDLAILERRPGVSEARLEAIDFAVPVAVTTDEARPVLDLPHRNEDARYLFGRKAPITIDALAWLSEGEALPDVWRNVFDERFRLTVDSQVAWRPEEVTSGEPLDVVKQVSFLHASAGTDEATFRRHYRHHVELARKHMPALWQYVQNDVEKASGDSVSAVGVVAVSELWFRTTDDFLNRYFPSEADRLEFSAQEGFLDLTRATSFVCTSHVSAADGGAT